MFLYVLTIAASIVVRCWAIDIASSDISFRSEKYNHQPLALNDAKISKLSDLSNVTHMDYVLDNICIVRIVGTPQHKRVKEYIKRTMRDLNWTVETDIFEDQTPNFGKLQFENIIAKLNPNVKRYLTLACHYDSKYFKEGDFIGATDSAVPCAQMINLATVMKEQLKSISNKDISLMLLFFDGEEAFQKWGPQDSIYGARHLAKMWHRKRTTHGRDTISELDRIDMLILLDLIGAPDPTFYSYFENTQRWYTILVNAESNLARLRKFESYSYDKPQQNYFQPYSLHAYIEDDHIPFLRKDVPILHIIPYPFPSFWHKPGDNRSNVDMKTTENINKILRVFVASYLHVDV